MFGSMKITLKIKIVCNYLLEHNPADLVVYVDHCERDKLEETERKWIEHYNPKMNERKILWRERQNKD